MIGLVAHHALMIAEFRRYSFSRTVSLSLLTLNIILKLAEHELDQRPLEVFPARGDEDETLGADLDPALHRRVEVVLVLVGLPPRPPAGRRRGPGVILGDLLLLGVSVDEGLHI